MILVLGSHSQVRTLQERQVPKALKIHALERVRIILSCLATPDGILLKSPEYKLVKIHSDSESS